MIIRPGFLKYLFHGVSSDDLARKPLPRSKSASRRGVLVLLPRQKDKEITGTVGRQCDASANRPSTETDRPGTGDRNGKEEGKSKKEKVGMGEGNASTHLPIHASTHLKNHMYSDGGLFFLDTNLFKGVRWCHRSNLLFTAENSGRIDSQYNLDGLIRYPDLPNAQ